MTDHDEMARVIRNLELDDEQNAYDDYFQPRSSIKRTIRHKSVPLPSGCRWCRRDPRLHGSEWVPSVRLHHWVEPTLAQRKARIFAVLRKHPYD